MAQEPLIAASGPGPYVRREASTRERLRGGRGFWIAWTVLAALTLALTLGAHWTAWYPGDVRLARTIQSLDVPLIGGILHSETTIGSPWPAVTLVVALTLVLLVIRHAVLAVLVVGTNALRGVGSVVKDLVIRPRPTVRLVRVTEHASGTRFPSGHASVSLRRRQRRTPGDGNVLPAAIRLLKYPVPGGPPTDAAHDGQRLAAQRMTGVPHHDRTNQPVTATYRCCIGVVLVRCSPATVSRAQSSCA